MQTEARPPEARPPEPQPLGLPVPGWRPRPRPPATAIEGLYCRLERLTAERHAAQLFEASAGTPESWTYLPQDPPANFTEYESWIAASAQRDDPFFHAIIANASGLAVGVAALMRIDPANGVIEVGSIHYAPALRRTRAGTEAIYLLMRRVFDELGYRRFEWKCDSLHARSRHAALRYGFRFEGIFRQAVVYKGRNRDTAWFSIIDSEWPRLRAAYAAWLDPANFDAKGCQLRTLAAVLAGDG